MSFKINPCHAINVKINNTNTSKNTHGGGININNMNDLCYGICNAYGNPNGCDKQCATMLSAKKQMMGKTDCSLRIPRVPIWNQIPRYFPALLRKTNNVKKAYNQCCAMAAKSIYTNSTRDMCKLDADSIVGIEESTESFTSNYDVDYGGNIPHSHPSHPSHLSHPSHQSTYHINNGHNRVLLLLGIILSCVLLVFYCLMKK